MLQHVSRHHMPRRPPSPCPRCGVPVEGGGLCDLHRQQRAALVDQQRGTAASRGYGAKWRAYRAAFLRSHPLCAACAELGVVTPATDVDHIRPHGGDWSLFWDRANHQALCHPCHSRKTATHDGGFGR